MSKSSLHQSLIAAILTGLLACSPEPVPTSDEGPSPPKTPAEELASFRIEPGLKIQLVASEPMVQDPVVIQFDPDGRLWVVEMRGFMPNIEAEGENEPVGRVSVLEDTDGDGEMDKSTIYLDSLIMPRALALLDGGALVAENQALWMTEDLDGDLKADSKTLIDPDYAGSALPEHSGNGLLRAADNWYYNAKSRLRYRLEDGQWIRDSTEFRGQWGISQDDQGRLYYNYNWSQLHADLVPPNYLSRNANHVATTGIDHGLTVERRIYPIRPNPAINRGYIPGTLDEDGKLLEFTSACSPFYYRGTALSGEFYGNVFVCEPSGNLVKRNVVKEAGLQLSAYDPHPGTEFLASTDERFRPVSITSGPDGALYIADMYRGLVQHGKYITPYLKEKTIERKLVLPINRGRIWRIVPEDWEPQRPERLSEASAEKLVSLLSHPDGWYRDMAQRLLVERKPVGAVRLLGDLAENEEHNLGRFHALWTLEGMRKINPDLLLRLLSDPDPLVSATALRLLEPIAAQSPGIRQRLEEILPKIARRATEEMVLQMALSAEVLDQKTAYPLLAEIADKHGNSALIRDAVLSSLHAQEFPFLQALWNSTDWKQETPSQAIFLEMLTSAVIRNRDPAQLTALLDMLNVDENEFGWRQKALLTSLSIQGRQAKTKPITLAAAPEVLQQNDNSNFAVLASLFEWPGHTINKSEAVQKNQLTDEEQQQFALGRQHYLTTCSGCHGTDGAGLNRFAPPLAGSEWVLGNDKQLALIILHGMEGPLEVAGKIYDAPEILPVMPAHTTLDDAAIASIMTYIRNEWGNVASPVSRRLVGKTRLTSQGRVMPWKVDELAAYVLENQEATED
jgi:mono/diheme cytochrome c family protein/glucose/arabinose dehydrogenase